MTIDTFDLETFKQALPENAYQRGVEMGEYVFSIPVDNAVSIVVRSSIHVSGESAKVGEDSIRLWLSSNRTSSPLGKLDTYTTRVPGWERRLQIKIAYLKEMRQKAGDCYLCNDPKHLFVVVKDGPNKGRPFAKCMNCDSGFVWLDVHQPPAYFAPVKQKSEENQVTDSDALDMLMAQDEISDNVPMTDEPESSEIVLAKSVQALAVFENPNEEQKRAIEAPFNIPVRVSAGPGSGKTFTIKYRYRNMIDNNIKPEEIIAVTFNVKMADELRTKISAVCHEIAENVQANRQICTIHALCYRFLKEYYKEWRGLELAPEWWIKKTVLELLEKYFKNASNRPAYEETRDVIFTSKFHGFSSEDCGAFFSNVMEEYYAEKITSIRQEFDRKLVENHYMTFSDQLLSMELGLRNDPNFKSFCQAKFNYLIVDEGQDTSKQAMTILSSLIDHTNNIFIVGDTDQLLYRFTGASPEFNMTDGFEMRYPNGLTFNLETNYRSTNAIVETSLKSIRNNYSDYDGPYDVRYMKKLVAATSEKGMPITFKSFADPVEEAKGIAQDISADLQNGRKPDDYFIGFRTRAQAGYLEAVFAFTDIPYVNTTGVSFWSLKHIQALLSYLKLANNIGDSSDFENVFNVPSRLFTVPWRSHPDYGTYCNHRFLGRQFVAECNSDISRLRRMTTIPKYAPGAVDFLMILNELTSLEDPREAVTYLIDEVFRKYLNFETGNSENNVGEGAKIDDLATVVEVAGMFSNIPDFIQYVNKMVESSKANIEGDWTGKVVFSTIHRLKGLERPVVFGVGICEGSAMTTPPVGLLPHTFSIADPPSTGKLNLSGRGRVEDERCLFYVLITRAKQEVHLSYPVTYRKSLMRPSRFIDEIGLGKILELPGDR